MCSRPLVLPKMIRAEDCKRRYNAVHPSFVLGSFKPLKEANAALLVLKDAIPLLCSFLSINYVHEWNSLVEVWRANSGNSAFSIDGSLQCPDIRTNEQSSNEKFTANHVRAAESLWFGVPSPDLSESIFHISLEYGRWWIVVQVSCVLEGAYVFGATVEGGVIPTNAWAESIIKLALLHVGVWVINIRTQSLECQL